jgi:hypothetical protein
MSIDKTINRVGEYIGIVFLYGIYICIGMGFIWTFFIAPAIMMSSRFGLGWGIAWMLVLPLLAYIGRKLWRPAKMG